ncbi:MAG: replication-relaxation family protein [Chloroflexi bacterium]|nr:replication-relaxation family protein [Chloroflexota bacterium]
MKTASSTRDRILAVLAEHPFLSRRQIELCLGCPERTIRQGLADLEVRQWIWQANARHAGMHARCIYAPTHLGMDVLAQQAGLSIKDYRKRTGLSTERLARLILLMERVFQLRTMVLWFSLLANPLPTSNDSTLSPSRLKRAVSSNEVANPQDRWRWHAVKWDVEVGKFFANKSRGVWIPFHGAALMQRGLGASVSSLPNTKTPANAANRSSNVNQELYDKQKEGRWAFVVIEFDLAHVSVERDRERFDQFVVAQDDPRYWGKENEPYFPTLIVVARDELRLQDYYNVLRSTALARQLPMPRAYLTTMKAAFSLRKDTTLPVWYSTTLGRQTSILGDTEGIALPLPPEPLWRKLPLNPTSDDTRNAENNGVTLAPASAGVTPDLIPENKSVFVSLFIGKEKKGSTPLPQTVYLPSESSEAGVNGNGKTEVVEKKNGAITPQLNTNKDARTIIESPFTSRHSSTNAISLARIALAMPPLEKRLLAEIAAHPLLTQQELGVLLQASLRHVRPGLAHLMALNLIQPHDEHFLIVAKGQQYLAYAAGFGSAVKRYARARGWGKGFDTLLRHREHTKAENQFFLELANIAITRGHMLTWLSELESRLYYEAGQRWHSFLPDGRGSYIARNVRYEFAVEIDRSRSSTERLRIKLAEYEACITSNVLRSEGIELLRLLVLTNSWERAETWCRAAESLRSSFPMFITTFERVNASGADSSIWLRGDQRLAQASVASQPKVYCFECFERQDPKASSQ